MTLNTQETATVLAALRLWQESIVESEKDYGKQNLFDNLPDRFRDFFNDRNLPEITFPLDAEEIDALCERLNFDEGNALDTSDEHLRAIAEQRNLAMWWFDEDYVRDNHDGELSPEAVTQIVKDLAGDAGVQERIAEEVIEYINNHKE